MSSVAEIEAAISQLSQEDFARLSAWFDETRQAQWDRQIESDSNSGGLDFLLKEVEKDAVSGLKIFVPSSVYLTEGSSGSPSCL